MKIFKLHLPLSASPLLAFWRMPCRLSGDEKWILSFFFLSLSYSTCSRYEAFHRFLFNKLIREWFLLFGSISNSPRKHFALNFCLYFLNFLFFDGGIILACQLVNEIYGFASSALAVLIDLQFYLLLICFKRCFQLSRVNLMLMNVDEWIFGWNLPSGSSLFFFDEIGVGSGMSKSFNDFFFSIWFSLLERRKFLSEQIAPYGHFPAYLFKVCEHPFY